MGLQRLGLLSVLLLGSTTPLHAGSLDDLARETEAQGQVAVPLRADIEAQIDGVEGRKEERIVLLVRRSPSADGVDVLVSVGDGRERHLVLADGTAHSATGGKARKVALDIAIDGTSWSLGDLLPFTIERCGVMRNIDESARQMTILCNPVKGQETPYVLSVYKIDREKAFPTRVLYYQERQDNLVKMLRNEELRLVGRKWRPTKMVMKNFKLRTRDVFEASWTQDPTFPPEIFDPAGFAEATLPPAPSPAATR